MNYPAARYGVAKSHQCHSGLGYCVVIMFLSFRGSEVRHGIQATSRQRQEPVPISWIPAFAGMTGLMAFFIIMTQCLPRGDG